MCVCVRKYDCCVYFTHFLPKCSREPVSRVGIADTVCIPIFPLKRFIFFSSSFHLSAPSSPKLHCAAGRAARCWLYFVFCTDAHAAVK